MAGRTRTALNFLRSAQTRCGTITALGLLELAPASDGAGRVNVNNSPLDESAAKVFSQLVIFSMLALLVA